MTLLGNDVTLDVWDFPNIAKNSILVKQELAETLARGNRQVKQQFLKELDSTDFLATYLPLFPTYAIRPRNLAHTMAIYWLTMWSAIHGDDLPSPETYLAVVGQCAKRLVGDPNAKNADKRQQMGEATMYESLFAMEGIKRARESGKAEELKKLSDMTHGNCVKRGLNFRSMALTPEGFVGVGS